MPVADKLRHLLVEKCNQQRGDMGAVNIGIRHDDDFFVAQAAIVIARARAATQRLHQIANLLALLHFGCRGIGDIQNFAAQGKNGLVFRLRACFCAAAGTVALDNEDLRAFRRGLRNRPACPADAVCARLTCE